MSSDNPFSIPAGIVIGLLASCVQSLGLTIQRKSHVINQSLPDHLQRVEHRRPLWLLGFAVFISSNIFGSLVQIASLPVVILAPLGAVSLLWNAFFARFLLGDVFSPWMILGTILIAGGAVLIAVFGIVPDQAHSLEDLLELFRRPTFVVYFSILGFVLFVSLAVTHLMEFSLFRRTRDTSPSFNLSTSTTNIPCHDSISSTTFTDDNDEALHATERTPLLDPKFISTAPSYEASGKEEQRTNTASVNRTRLILAICYASFSGIISGMCLLFAKSGVELLLLTVRGKNQFWRLEAWFLILGLIAFALLQLWYFHKALILADPTIVCPSAFCFYNLSSIVNGLIYFDQFSFLQPLHVVLVSLGIVILLSGIWVVSIQPDGGGIDIGIWDEEFVELNAEELEAARIYVQPNETTSSAETVPLIEEPTSQRRERFRSVPMKRGTRSESSVTNVAGEEALSGFGRRRLQHSLSHDRRPQRAETLYASPRIPSVVSRRSTITSDHTIQARATSQSTSPPFVISPLHSHLHGTLSPPLGAGLQIGLSPLSPGFIVLPVERRRASAYTSGVAEGSDIENISNVNSPVNVARTRLWDLQRRRTVSDGASSRMNWSLDETETRHDVEAVQERTVQPRSDTRPMSDSHLVASVNRSKVGWRWLKRVFRDRFK